MEFGGGLGSKSENGVDFFLGNRGGVVAGADEAGDALGGAHRQPGVIADDHLDEHVAGEDFFLDGAFFTFADFDFFLGGDKDFVDVIGQAHRFNLGPEGVGGPGFVAGIGMNDVPLGVGRGVGVDDEMILIFFWHVF